MPTPAQFWDRAAVKYSKSKIRDLDHYHFTLERTQSYLRPTDHVLELGCGTGSTALLLAPSVERLVATDVSSKMIEIAKGKLGPEQDGLHFDVASVQKSCEDNPKQDAILAHNLLHLLDNIEESLSAIHTALKPGGVFISKSACLGEGAWYFGAMIGLMQAFGKAPYVARFGVSELDAIVKAAGFEIIETQTKAGKIPTQYIVAKRL